MNIAKCLQVASVFAFVMVSCVANAETDEVLVQRNNSLRQQHNRVNEVLMQNQSQSQGITAPSQKTSGSFNGMAAARFSNSPGMITLSARATVNQQLRQGMSDVRASLMEIKAAPQDEVALEQQRSLANVALDQAVQAYLMCRAEAKVPINAHYEYDPFLKEMIFIKNALIIKDIDVEKVDEMLDRLVAARTILVTLTEARQ